MGEGLSGLCGWIRQGYGPPFGLPRHGRAAAVSRHEPFSVRAERALSGHTGPPTLPAGVEHPPRRSLVLIPQETVPMSPILAALLCFCLYLIGFKFYGKYLGRRIFRLDPNATTPAHELNDGVDYVPANRWVLFGHHYASIAGLSPMLGPAIAVIWGWVPALLWVVLGTLFIGAVHDFQRTGDLHARQGNVGGEGGRGHCGPPGQEPFPHHHLLPHRVGHGGLRPCLGHAPDHSIQPTGRLPQRHPHGGRPGRGLARLQAERIHQEGHGNSLRGDPPERLDGRPASQPRPEPGAVERDPADLQPGRVRIAGLVAAANPGTTSIHCFCTWDCS